MSRDMSSSVRSVVKELHVMKNVEEEMLVIDYATDFPLNVAPQVWPFKGKTKVRRRCFQLATGQRASIF